jgi:putative membrane protein
LTAGETLSERDFLRPEARDEARRAVAEIERRTSAEVVITVRRIAGRYREADYLGGFLLSLATLLALLFLPREFALWTFPLDVALGFALGAWITSGIAPLRRLLTPRTVRKATARSAAHLAFAEARLSRLPGRNAILVFLSLFEREAVVVPDLGIDPARLGPAWSGACGRLGAALERGPDWGRTLEALRALGPALAEAYPRSADDVNELPDEVTQQ